MPVFLVKAASISSSAFLIDAAAKTVRSLSSAKAGVSTGPLRSAHATAILASQDMDALRAARGAAGRAKSALVNRGTRQAKERFAGPADLRSARASHLGTITG